MSRLRVQADIEPLTRHVHVEILEQLGHLRDEHIATALAVDEVVRAPETSAGPARERRHSRRISGIAATAARSAARRSAGAAHAGRAVRRRTAPTSAATTATATS